MGKLSGLSYQPDMEAGFFDPESNQLYPKINRFSCTFTVLHLHPMGYNIDDGFRWGTGGFAYGPEERDEEAGLGDGNINTPPPVAPDSGGIRFAWSDDDSNEAVPAPESQAAEEDRQASGMGVLGALPSEGIGALVNLE